MGSMGRYGGHFLAKVLNEGILRLVNGIYGVEIWIGNIVIMSQCLIKIYYFIYCLTVVGMFIKAFQRSYRMGAFSKKGNVQN